MDEREISTIQAAIAGDHDAFQQLVDRFHDTVVLQMRRFSTDRSTIEELAHDVFVEAFLSLKSFRGHSPFAHWLRKIAVRVGYRYWKQRARQKLTTSLSEFSDTLEVLDGAETLAKQEASELVTILLGRLKPRDRLVLTLQYLDGLSTMEISRLTGWTEAMVKVQAYRARNRLRKLAEETK